MKVRGLYSFMATKKNLGFKGQWVDIITAGTHTDNKGEKHEIDHAFLERVVSNYDPSIHESPAVIGHPKEDAPAFGWVCGMRIERAADSEVLQAQFCDADSTFERLVEEGRFKKRSAAFYLDAQTAPGGRAPYLRHVGFLGAQPPAVKGLREIKFNEGEAVTFDITFSEGEGMDEEKVKSTVKESIKEFLANMFGSKDEGTQANFSEAELDARIKKTADAAAAAATAAFEEKFTAQEEVIKGLKERLDQHSGSATRTEIISFCERLGAGKFLPAFKRMGVIEFMETLATVPDRKVSVITFAEKDGREVEKKVEISPLQFFQNFLQTLPAFIEFGEKLGDMQLKGDATVNVDPEAVEGLRAGMGVKKPEGGKQ